VKPAPFEYHIPDSLSGCLAVLAEHGDDAKVLAGGQSLVPMLALRLAYPEHLVDLNHVPELRAVSREDGVLLLGALTRHATLERDPLIAEAVPLLARVAPHIGHFQIRNRGTLGGSLAHADPAAELPGVARALDAEIEIAGPDGRRRVGAADFFETVFTTCLGPEEILVAVRFPVWGGGSGFAVEQVARRHGDFALVGAMTGVQVSDGRITRAAIAMTGVGTVPARRDDAEQSLVGQYVADVDLTAVGRRAAAGLSPSSDLHASSEYRTQVGAALVTRALTNAIKEASTHD
jgi:carbon-monoxide dehydrogenase medium subunit